MATRKQIREAIKDLITPLFNKTFSYGVTTVDRRDFPLAAVYIENGSTEAQHGGSYETESTVIVEVWAADAEDLDAVLDAHGNAVNALIDQDETLAGLVIDTTRSGYSYERDEDSFTGTITLTFNITYNDED